MTLLDKYNAMVDTLKSVVALCADGDADEPFELWTILEPIEGHPQYSTLSRRTIEAKGKIIVQVERGEQ